MKKKFEIFDTRQANLLWPEVPLLLEVRQVHQLQVQGLQK
jgi:hypothetical protein